MCNGKRERKRDRGRKREIYIERERKKNERNDAQCRFGREVQSAKGVQLDPAIARSANSCAKENASERRTPRLPRLSRVSPASWRTAYDRETIARERSLAIIDFLLGGVTHTPRVRGIENAKGIGRARVRSFPRSSRALRRSPHAVLSRVFSLIGHFFRALSRVSRTGHPLGPARRSGARPFISSAKSPKGERRPRRGYVTRRLHYQVAVDRKVKYSRG